MGEIGVWVWGCVRLGWPTIDVVEGLEGLLGCVGVVEVEGYALVVLTLSCVTHHSPICMCPRLLCLWFVCPGSISIDHLKPLAHPSGDVESGHGKEVPVFGVLSRLDHQLPG